MSFYEYWLRLQEYDITGDVTDPKRISRHWYGNIPKRTSDIDAGLCKNIGYLMGNTHAHDRAIAGALFGHRDQALMLVDTNIIGSVIKGNIEQGQIRQKLATIKAGIVCTLTDHHSDFGFSIDDQPVGYIELFVSPIPGCGTTEQVTFFGVTLHETRHAYDWMIGKIAMAKNNMDISLDQYLMDPAEMRAFSEQMLSLLEVCMDEFNVGWDKAQQMVLALENGESVIGDSRRVGVITEFFKLLGSRKRMDSMWNRQSEAVAAVRRSRYTSVEQVIAQIHAIFVKVIDFYAVGGKKLMLELQRRSMNDYRTN